MLAPVRLETAGAARMQMDTARRASEDEACVRLCERRLCERQLEVKKQDRLLSYGLTQPCAVPCVFVEVKV